MYAPLHSCFLEVNVNGEETFFVDKELLCAYSRRLCKLFGRLKSTSGQARNLKVIFNDFPGGARSFELLLRFCYNKGNNFTLTPFDIPLLQSAVFYLEMDKTVVGTENLVWKINKSLEGISYWSWNELLAALKHCQDTMNLGTSSNLLRNCVEALVRRLGSTGESTSYPSSSFSSDSSNVQFSFDTKSTKSLKYSALPIIWWFQDLSFLSPEFLQHVVKSMVSQKLDNLVISKFLFFYQKSRFATSVAEEKRRLIMAVVDMLYLLDWSVLSFKSSMRLLGTASSAKVEKLYMIKLEKILGSQMHKATLDSLLIPSPNGVKYLYDVNLVLRLLKAFVRRGSQNLPLERLQNVGSLMDMYIAEVVPDPSLKPSKLLALITALPDRARESFDGIYHAIYLYQQVHTGLSQEDLLKICSALNYDKLSPEARDHLARNTKFPIRPAMEVFISQQFRLKSTKKLENISQNLASDVIESITTNSNKKALIEGGARDIAASGKLVTLEEDLHDMQWKVMELEKVCTEMHKQMIRVTKSRPGSQTVARYLPYLCS